VSLMMTATGFLFSCASHQPIASPNHRAMAAEVRDDNSLARIHFQARSARVRSAHGAPACQPCASILIVPAYPLHREFEAFLVAAFGHEVEVLVGALQRLPVPRSSEYPAFSRDHWAVGRPLVRSVSIMSPCGQAVGESSHVSCRP
jgi:hypothetical protein